MAYVDDDDDSSSRQPYPPAKALTPAELEGLLSQFPWTDQQLGRIYRDAGGWCGADDLAKFLYICEKRNLDPLLGEVHADFRWSNKIQRFNLVPIVHIDGIRKLADLTKQYDGQEDPVFTTDSKGQLIACTVRVYRKDCAHPFGATCFLLEYAKGLMWRKMPHVMLAKVTEMAALRKAFPAALGGVYIPEELDRNDDDSPAGNGTPPAAEEFKVGQKTNGAPKQEVPPPSPLPPPQPPLGGVPGGGAPPPPTQTMTMPSELEVKTSKRMSNIRSIVQEAGKLDAPATTKAVNAFMRGFLGVTTLPKDPESYQAPLAALEAMTAADIGELAKDPAKAAAIAREPLEQHFDTWKWSVELCGLAKGFIRVKAMSHPQFIEFATETGAAKLSSDDAAAFLSLALVTSKAYMILTVDRNGKSVTDLIAALGGVDHFKGMDPLEAAKHIGSLGN